jgi:hypothetical protein
MANGSTVDGACITTGAGEFSVARSISWLDTVKWVTVGMPLLVQARGSSVYKHSLVRQTTSCRAPLQRVDM